MKSKRKDKFKHYGSQTSKETLKRSGKYIPPEKPNLFKKIPTIYKPYYFLEKRVLEPVDAWISKQAFFTILGRLGNLAIVVAIVSFVLGENVRRNNEVFAAWQTITSAHEQSGSGGRIKALQFLNSRPWRFPWIGWTEKDWYWDERDEKCKLKRLIGRRWKREPLVGLSAPDAYLANIHLCGAELFFAKLQGADLFSANLQRAFLEFAKLQGADLSGANLQKAFLWGANLQEADLGSANLQEAKLFSANLQKAFLWGANLQKAFLWGANLQKVRLESASLQRANLDSANLQGAYLYSAKNLTHKQIKLACFWDKAIYEGEWNWNKETKTWEAKNEQAKQDNAKFIEKLKKDKSSDPKEPVDCSIWSI